MSVSKSGRTWLRVILDYYFNTLNHEENINNNSKKLKFFYTHEFFEHRNNANFFEKVKGRYIMPDNIAKSKKIIFLYRDPRDVIVSYFHQKTKRSSKRVNLNMSEFIRHPTYGIYSIIYVMNTWKKRLESHQWCHCLSYEELKIKIYDTLYSTIKFLSSNPVCSNSLNKAIDYATFEKMQKRETACLSKQGELLPGDPSDPESFKVRKGKIGSYTEELTEDDRLYVDQALNQLDPFFGYSPN
ncbi:sulfotransferase domain-containing protein [Desulfohalobium retbaense]|uniref:sulfotransferase domain-containing protein n=1 Tax=Desulfohalobium retbaense TaxID=45663 RepID=UPI0009FD5523|nr:sulfotransferase domain-containing protein [Desulfohalobium retbaense]